MMMYKDVIKNLIEKSPLDIDVNIKLSGRTPTMANSEFLINKEQGDWAEKLVLKTINEYMDEFFAVKYGCDNSIAAGDEGFDIFYKNYQEELNSIGKRPDILIFKAEDFPDKKVDIEDIENIKKAVAGIEIRSSSFLVDKYYEFMDKRQYLALKKCKEIRDKIINSKLGKLLQQKNETIYKMIANSTENTFKELDFRRPSWSSTQELIELTDLLKELKESIKVLHKRDHLSITPKLEDIALVNRWIQKYNVKHFYLQVFFDKAYVISFKDILKLISNSENEGHLYFIERDVKNQRKTTIKINIKTGKEVIGKIDMPKHKSGVKELERGRLLFYVKFKGGKGYIDKNIFIKEIINA